MQFRMTHSTIERWNFFFKNSEIYLGQITFHHVTESQSVNFIVYHFPYIIIPRYYNLVLKLHSFLIVILFQCILEGVSVVQAHLAHVRWNPFKFFDDFTLKEIPGSSFGVWWIIKLGYVYSEIILISLFVFFLFRLP